MAGKPAELHGGSDSATTVGTAREGEFMLRLPAADGQATPPARRKSVRILIVDDNKDLALGLARLLGFLGHHVDVAFDGPEGVEAARGVRPDVIVLDIGLPKMDGYEVARTLRADASLAGVLIIAVSGYGEEDRRRSREVGMDHYLIKPVDVRAIADLIAPPG